MNIRAGMNLAAIHHKFGALEDAIPAYEKIISLLSQVNATIDQVYMLRYIICFSHLSCKNYRFF